MSNDVTPEAEHEKPADDVLSGPQTTRRAVVVCGSVAAGAAAMGLSMVNGFRLDPYHDSPHGRGEEGDSYGPSDVIYSMCMQCNTFCTIAARLGPAGESGATSLVRKLSGNPYSNLSTVPYGPIPYATPPVKAVQASGNMAVNGVSKVGGRICLKGQAGLQTCHDATRLTKPLKRVGERGSGKWKTISWDEAYELIVNGDNELGIPGVKSWYKYAPEKDVMADWDKVKAKQLSQDEFTAKWGDRLIDPAHPDLGPRSNWLTVLGGDRMGFVGERMTKNAFGSVNSFNHAGVCGASSVAANARLHPTTGHQRMFADLDSCQYLIVWGTEPLTASKGPTWLAPRISVARRRGMKLVVVDPRLSKTAEKADVWVPLRPGTDAALALAMARVIIEAKGYDEKALRACGRKSAAAAGEPNWSDATHLVKVDDPKKGMLTVEDLQSKAPLLSEGGGQAGAAVADPVPVVLVGGQPQPSDQTAGPADLEVDTTLQTPSGSIRVKSVFVLLRERVMERTVEEAAKLCAVPAATITAVAAGFTKHGKRACVTCYRGPSMHVNGFDAVRAIGYLNFLLGNQDHKGGQITNADKFPPATGAYDLAKVPGGRKAWGVPITREKSSYAESTLYQKDKPSPRRWYPIPANLCHEVLPSAKARYPYHCKALFIHRHSPIDSSPGGTRQAEVLKDTKAIELLVGFDIAMGDTTQYCDVALPDTSYLERFTQEPIYPNQPYQLIQLGQPVTRAFDGPRSVEQIYIDLWKRLGVPGVGEGAFDGGGKLDADHDYYLKMAANVASGGAKPVPDATAEEQRLFVEARRKALGKYFDEGAWRRSVKPEEWPRVVYVLNRGGRFEAPGKEYDEKGWITHRDKNAQTKEPGGQLAFYDPKTAMLKDAVSGKAFDGIARYRPPTYADGREVDRSLPLQMINWKSRQLGTHRTANDPWLREIRADNYLWISPTDALGRGLRSGDRVKIASKAATMEATVQVTQGILPGVVGANFSGGQGAYGARSYEVDGVVVPPVDGYGHTIREEVPGHEETGYAVGRGSGFKVNDLLEDDTQHGGGGLTDPIGGNASQLDLWVEVIKV